MNNNFIKKCKNCKYFHDNKMGWGKCSEFGNSEHNEQNCCQFWYPNTIELNKEKVR